MNLEKVVFGFFVLLAATLNFGFFIGDLGDPELHNSYELYAAVVVNLIATVLKFGDRTQIGAVHLATSLVADLQLISAALVWGYASYVAADGLTARGDRQRRVAVGRRAAGQHRVGGAAGGRDRVVPPPLTPPTNRGTPWATRCWCSGTGCSTGEEQRRAPDAPLAGAHRVGHPGVGDDLPGHAPDAGAADRPDRDLRRQHARAHADPGPGRRGPALADGLLRRLLRHELHRLDDRVRRDPVRVHLQPADVGDHLDLPDGGRLGLRDRVAARAGAGTQLPPGAGAAALHPQGPPARASRSC